ncbi:MAG: IPT/TIG domain-containing protein, partial [Candidatus Sericytochromatia bacterium]|nr:IPT/TIG domain-containing protein [Candidatus Tanganyikabacteria bacterium]
ALPALAFAPAEPALAQEVDQPPLPGHGHVVIRIRWPERGVQAIPQGTQLIRITAVSKVVSSYDKKQDFTSASTKHTFQNAPAGLLTLSAYAYNTTTPAVGATPLASASADLTIQSGAVLAAKLVLNSGGQPTITKLDPKNGATKAQIELQGTNFGSGTDVFKVFVDGKEVAGADIFRTSISQAYFLVPDWATRSLVTVSVIRGNATASVDAADSLVRLKSISLAETSKTITKGATASIVLNGTDTQDGTVSNVRAKWFAASGADASNHDHAGDSCMCLPGLVADPDTGVLTANAAGAYHVMARNGILLATASVTVP